MAGRIIGILDSGVGGLSVQELIVAGVPHHSVIYIADHAYAPYGNRDATDLIERTGLLVERLLEWSVDMVVIACNTATVTSIEALRRRFPHLPFVGMEPAIKPAARQCERIVVLGTRCTVTNDRYRQLCREQAGDRTIWHIAAPELVAQVEAGDLDNADPLRRLLHEAISSQAEAIVIGCTHFSFLVPTIERTWPHLQVFDGRYGTVKRVRALLGSAPGDVHPGVQRCLTTGPAREFRLAARHIAFEPLTI